MIKGDREAWAAPNRALAAFKQIERSIITRSLTFVTQTTSINPLSCVPYASRCKKSRAWAGLEIVLAKAAQNSC